jgi:hypothetical protein
MRNLGKQGKTGKNSAPKFPGRPKITGVEFDEVWSRRVDVQIDDDLSEPFISRQDLLIAKLAAGRAQDLIDVDALRESSESQ